MHVREGQIGTGLAQGLGMADPAMAAAVKAEHFHPGGPRAGDAGKAVLDHDTARGRDAHFFRSKQEQVRRRLAVRHLRGREDVRREAFIEPRASETHPHARMRTARGNADTLRHDVEHVVDAADRFEVGFEYAKQLILQIAVVGLWHLTTSYSYYP